jgi:hypothetical protein
MLKSIPLVLLALITLAGCAEKNVVAEAKILTFQNLSTETADYVGQRVTVSGAVVHVCRSGGKRMFITGESPEPRFKITAGEAIGAFDMALEGSNVTVTGLVEEQRVDEVFLNEWEAELEAEEKPEVAHKGGGSSTAEEVEDHHESVKDQISNMRKKLAESDKEYLSFYSLDCDSFIENK